MRTKMNNSTNPHPAQPYFLPRRVIPLTAFHPAPQPPAQPPRLPWLVRVAWDALFLAGKVRANEEAR